MSIEAKRVLVSNKGVPTVMGMTKSGILIPESSIATRKVSPLSKDGKSERKSQEVKNNETR